MDSSQLRDRLIKLQNLKQEYRRLEKDAKDARKEHDAYQAQLYNEMHEHAIDSVKHDGTQFVRKSTLYGKVTDEEAFYTWAVENGMEDIYFAPKEQSGRVNELVREHFDLEKELPPGVSWYPREYISITENK